jgi:hypothetical protein
MNICGIICNFLRVKGVICKPSGQKPKSPNELSPIAVIVQNILVI